MRKLVLAGGLGVGLCAAAVLVLWARPPDLIRVGANYTAKIVCSNAFLTKRDPAEVLATDVQAPGHPLLKFMRIDVDREPGVNPDAAYGITPGTFWMSGHDGQYAAIIPSRQLVIVRMGLTPSRLLYPPEALVTAVLRAAPSEPSTAISKLASNDRAESRP